MNLLLANIDYKKHTSTEGEELQAGLAQHGWLLAGHGYGDNCKHIPTLIDRHKPRIVLSHDQCDWHSDYPGCFDPVVSFTGIECLAQRDDIFKAVIVKDASTMLDDPKRTLALKIKANATVLYYHERSAFNLAPWLLKYKRVRTYHSIDRDICESVVSNGQLRDRAIITGAMGGCYPIRQLVADNAALVGVHHQKHPGYGNIGSQSNGYLSTLSNFKVHVATASQYGFSLRKIIESVAVGCTPVTNLPLYDQLPEIDEALVRIPKDPSLGEIKEAIDRAEAEWTLDRAMHFAQKAWNFYDWRVRGAALSEGICNVAGI